MERNKLHSNLNVPTTLIRLWRILRCGPKEIRTPNPLVANEVRYRCAMGPSQATLAQGKPIWEPEQLLSL